MVFTDPQPFEEALKKLDERQIVLSPLRSREWREQVPTALRDRAFFSSTLENARVAQAMRDFIADYLAKAIDPATGGLKAQGRAEFVAELRELCIREGLGKLDPITGEIAPEIDETDITDLRSMARLQLIFDVQTTAAHEYGYWAQGNDPDLLYAYPAQRFIRVRPVRTPRPYHEANEGAVRRKDDLDFWLSMNPDFGVPWGPWGFNSGMGVEDVDRIEAEQLGLLAPGEEISSPERKLNDHLSAGIRDLDPDIRSELRQIFGSQIRESNDRMEWSGQNATGPIPRNPIGGIASMEQAQNVFRDRFGVRMVLQSPWGAQTETKLSEFERITHARRIAAEIERITNQWPGTRGRLKGFINNQPAGALGWGSLGGPDPHVISFAGDSLTADELLSVREFEEQTGRRWAIPLHDGITVREDIFRHELGHALTRPEHLQKWPLSSSEARQAISEYAGTNPAEAIAEAFCLFTSPDYQPGRLPPAVEAFMLEFVK